MKTIFLCNRLGSTQAMLKEHTGPLRFFSLIDTQESFRIRDFLRTRPNSEELSRPNLFGERSASFRLKYIEFLGKVNERNRSLAWWAMPFTEKNPVAPHLCRDIHSFLLLVELIRSSDASLLVVNDSSELCAQIKAWARENRVRVVDSVKVPLTWRRRLKQFTPAGVFRVFANTLLRWTLSRKFRPPPDLSNGHVVITSVSHPRSFASPGVYRDAYFAPLIENLAATGEKAVVYPLLLERHLDQLKKLRSLQCSPPVVPWDSCLTFKSILVSLFRALALYLSPIRLRGPIEIDGLDLSSLVKRAVRETRRSGDIFMGYRLYYSSRNLAGRIKITRCIYIFENHAWEKMLLLGVRSVSPQTQMVGYQHASVTPGHTNFILQKDEAKVTPLPDMILTTGEVTKEWLEHEGNYPLGIIKTACALRQSNSMKTELKPRNRQLNQILVAMAHGIQEYVPTLKLLECAFVGVPGYRVRVRPHPSVPLEDAFKVAPLTRQDFYSASTSSLADDLQWADVVLYSSTTVGLEALAMGIPVVHLDLGTFLDEDPMFGWSEFKWSVADPSDLVKTIQQIEAIPEEMFEQLQHKGQKYVSEYLRPVTPSALKSFRED